MGFEEVVEGVEGGSHWVDDNMGRLVEQQTGFFVVSKVVRKTEHCCVSVSTHCSQVIY